MKTTLNKRQREIISEIEAIRKLLSLDHENISEYTQKINRLKLIKEQIIRARVVLWYSWLDEYLDYAISNYFFYKHRKTKTKINWYSKKYSYFKHGILEQMYPTQKIELVVKIRPSWEKYKRILYDVNGLRNSLAHSFFPEKRPKKPFYKDKNIFTLEGITLLESDMQKILSDSSSLI